MLDEQRRAELESYREVLREVKHKLSLIPDPMYGGIFGIIGLRRIKEELEELIKSTEECIKNGGEIEHFPVPLFSPLEVAPMFNYQCHRRD